MSSLPEPFASWFHSRGWTPYAHQTALLGLPPGSTTLLLAPTGAGKTLASFLPTLGQLLTHPVDGLHTLYISPLKALAADIHRNLLGPITDMNLPFRCEIRTGDTSAAQRTRQKKKPPHLLLTTPESLALLNTSADAPHFFRHLRHVIVDELHALADNKRGDLLSLNLARLRALQPGLTLTALTATVAEPAELARWLQPHEAHAVRILNAQLDPALQAARPSVEILRTAERVPWAGHSGRHAVPEIVRLIDKHRTTLVFVNTRAQAEILYRALSDATDGAYPLAIHHGSLDRTERLRTEAAMAAGAYRAIVATSSLDLGIDWGAVDLVLQVGAPKSAARLTQRIGRSNHTLDRPSRAVLIPTNRMEMIEAVAALGALRDGELDNRFVRTGALDVLAQHLVSACCAAPATPDELFDETRRAGPYTKLDRPTFDRVLEFAIHGGYALRRYDQFKKLTEGPDGRLAPASPAVIRGHKLNIGTIVGDPLLRVKFKTGRSLGEIEERFLQGLRPGQTFLFGGRVVKLLGIRNEEAVVTPATGTPEVPSYNGGRLPLTPGLARRVRALIADPEHWSELPPEAREWLEAQRTHAAIPRPGEWLVEAFPRGDRHYFAAHPFAGRNAHQTLGLLLTRRMESLGLQPLGFVANDYALAVWCLQPVTDAATAARLLFPDILNEEFQAWMDDTSVLKRAFRECAVIAGMIDRRQPGKERRSRQVTFSSDMIYDVLRQYEPGHILLQATRLEAARSLTDTDRLRAVLEAATGHIRFCRLPRASPLSIPLLMEVGREGVDGDAVTSLLEEEAQQLLAQPLSGVGRA